MATIMATTIASIMGLFMGTIMVAWVRNCFGQTEALGKITVVRFLPGLCRLKLECYEVATLK